jgi:Fe-S-cluster containining protein
VTCNLEVVGSSPTGGFEKGEVPERSKGADCKSVGYAFEGSNPSLPIFLNIEEKVKFILDNNFIEKGLRFTCTRCSSCCRHTPGYVFLSEKDINNLLRATNMSRAHFLKNYCRIVSVNGLYRLSLREKSNYDCIFWSDGRCNVYKNRPLQCKSYPFWSSILSSYDSWIEQKKVCPGIGRGTVYNKRKIENYLKKRTKEKFIELLPHNVATYIDDIDKIKTHG